MKSENDNHPTGQGEQEPAKALTIKEQAAAQPNVPHPRASILSREEPQPVILRQHPIRTFRLVCLLKDRRIPLNVAQRYCVEMLLTFGKTPLYGIGFRCSAGGYEVITTHRRYSKPPLSYTHIQQRKFPANTLIILSDFLDLLSLITHILPQTDKTPDFHVLNSPANLDASWAILGRYKRHWLFLHNNSQGQRLARQALSQLPACRDLATLYQGYTSLNDWTCHIGLNPVPHTRS